MKLVCVPHAGGSAAAFNGWQDDLGFEVVAAELPGRDGRRSEPPLTDVGALADDLANLASEPYALFGHSLGAIIAFEIARKVPPRLLFVSGSAAPDDQTVPDEPWHKLPDDRLLARLTELGGIPRDLDAELAALLLPRLRADCTAAETYAYTPGPPLPCPISVLGGEWDPTIHTGQLDGWGRHTGAGAKVRVFPGGHFFLDDNRSLVARALRKDLSR